MTSCLQHPFLTLSTNRGRGLLSPLAGVDFFALRALLAFDVAAPSHLALAGPGHLPTLGVVASSTADSVTVFVLVALAARGAIRVLAGFAKARRVLDVE